MACGVNKGGIMIVWVELEDGMGVLAKRLGKGNEIVVCNLAPNVSDVIDDSSYLNCACVLCFLVHFDILIIE